MSTTVGLPSSVIIRDLLLGLWFNRRRFFLIVFSAIAIAAAVASQVEPKYQARSTLLVLLGAEHALRPLASQQLMNSFNIDPEQVLRTEADILTSDDLHRAVIEQIGLANLYPDLLKPPGELAMLMKQAKAYVADTFGLSDREIEPIVLAERQFARNLTVAVDKKSHVIQLKFEHTDPILSAEVLKVLEARFFALRGKLYADRQAAIVEAEENRTRAQLVAADARLADFKRTHDIANFAERQKVLITQQGALEDQLTKTESAIAGLQARLTQLSQQLRVASGQPGTGAQSGGTPNAAAPLQGMVGAYQRRQQESQTTYRGSPAYDSARTEMMRSEGEIARMRSTQAFAVQQDVNKVEAELRGNQASRDAIKAQLQEIGKQLASVNADETQLHELDRARGVVEESYKAIAKVATDRRVIEDVEAKRDSSVRVVETPRVPESPRPIRLLILLVGAILGVVLGIVASIMSRFFRGVYLRPEALEVDTGLAVLAVVPDHKSLASPVVLVTPR
jgi:succinoglycan biosynthesis transport protein ExoP